MDGIEKAKPLTHTVSELRSVLRYEAHTGLFYWVKAGSGRQRGKPAGTTFDSRGYRRIRYDGVLYPEHRLAWAFAHGVLPPSDCDIDHIDGNPWNNRVENLRVATRSQNMRNQAKRKNNTSGFKGVSAVVGTVGTRWRAKLRLGVKQKCLGTFGTPEEAHAAYVAAARQHYGEFARAA